MKYKLLGDPTDFMREYVDGKTRICSTGKIYDTVGFFVNGYAIVEKNKKFGFIDQKGKEICKICYDDVGDFEEDVAEIMINDDYGYINNEGFEICPPGKYEAPVYIDGCGIIYAWGEYDRLVLIDKDGNEIVEHIYEDIAIEICSENFLAVCYDGKWCFLDTAGNRICEPKFDSVELSAMSIDDEIMIAIAATIDDDTIFLLEMEDEESEECDLLAIVDGELKTLDEI